MKPQDSTKELLRITDVMDYLHVGRRKATEILNRKGCPKLPRHKGQTFLVPRQAFEEWVAGGMK